MPSSTQGKSFHRLCARFSAVIIVDFYIDDFIFALFIFMKDGKAVNYNGSEIIGLIHLKYGKRTACMIIFFTVNAVFSREAGKRSTTGTNLDLYKPPQIMCVYQCMPIIFMTHRSFSVILSSHIGNPSVMTDGPM